MSYKGLEKARAERAAKEAAKDAKKAEREAKKVKKEAKKTAKEAEGVASPIPEVKEAGKKKLGCNKITQKRKYPEEAGALEPKAKVTRMSEALVEKDEIMPEPWRAPVARMW